MKKTLVLAILSFAGGVASSYGQGDVFLDNYSSSVHPLITYGPNSGGTLGAGIQDGFTVGLYFGEGAFAGSVAADPTGTEIPTSLHPLLQLGTGQGSTVEAYTSAFNLPGMFFSFRSFSANSAFAGVSTLMVVAYNGTSYTSSTIRGHSAAFELYVSWELPPYLGESMSTFPVIGIPEPSTLTLVSLGLASLLFARRRVVKTGAHGVTRPTFFGNDF